MKSLISRGVSMSVIDQAVLVDYNFILKVEELFPPGQAKPVLMGSDNHPYFMLYRLQGPYELTTLEHPVSQAQLAFWAGRNPLKSRR